jgi:hypothetical protein
MKLILQGNLSKPNPEENGILHNWTLNNSQYRKSLFL